MGRVISAIPGRDTKISLVNRTIKSSFVPTMCLPMRVYFFDEVLLIFCRWSGKERFRVRKNLIGWMWWWYEGSWLQFRFNFDSNFKWKRRIKKLSKMKKKNWGINLSFERKLKIAGYRVLDLFRAVCRRWSFFIKKKEEKEIAKSFVKIINFERYFRSNFEMKGIKDKVTWCVYFKESLHYFRPYPCVFSIKFDSGWNFYIVRGNRHFKLSPPLEQWPMPSSTTRKLKTEG